MEARSSSTADDYARVGVTYGQFAYGGGPYERAKLQLQRQVTMTYSSVRMWGRSDS